MVYDRTGNKYSYREIQLYSMTVRVINTLTEKYSSVQWPLVQSISQQTDKWAKQPSQVACVLENMKC